MSTTPLVEEQSPSGTVLLIVDMIDRWDGSDAEPLLKAARDMAPHLARLKARCRQAGVPVIYVNDNRGRWRSDFTALIQAAMDRGGDAADIVKWLQPEPTDYFVLKPKHSAFFSTPLELLLQHLEADRIVLGGVAADQCILATASDALMRDLSVVVVKDGIAASSPQRLQSALKYFEEVMQIDVQPGADIAL